MPKLSWSAFIELHPAAHLVAGVIPKEDVATVTARDSLALLVKLAKRLSLTGRYAMTVDRRSGPPEIHCAFARETDAARFAQALNATGVGRYPGEESSFTSFRAGASYLNLVAQPAGRRWSWWGRVIFYVADVGELYDRALAAGCQLTTAPRDAEWGERFFHLVDPDGHELSFARLLRSSV